MSRRPPSIRLQHGGLGLEVLTRGAAVRRCVLTDADGIQVDVVLGHRDPAAYDVRDGSFLGVVVGRLANRLDRGRFELDGVTYQVPALDRGNALHGGPSGFDTRDWTVESSAADRVTLSLVSDDGDQGFPGRLRVRVTYRLRGTTVTLDYRAETDAPTVVDLTNHAYFNLDGEGSGTVDDHVLQLPATAYLPLRDDQVPTGEVRPVGGTPLDLRAARRVGDLPLPGGLDHHFVVPGSGLRPVARLTGRSGRSLEVLTDRPGLQVYAGGQLDGSAVGLSGRPYGPRAGLALETQALPDAPHHPEFPSVVLRPGEVFATTTRWRFTPGR